MSLHRSVAGLPYRPVCLTVLLTAFLSAQGVLADPAKVFIDDQHEANAEQEVDEDSEEYEDAPEDAASYHLTDWLQPIPAAPAITFSPTITSPSGSAELASALFGDDVIARSLLSDVRRARASSPASNVVIGEEGKFRVATDAGSLLGRSRNVRGVATQKRTPIVSDPRIRGDRVGRLIASGSYWFPARQDLDTMLNKIDSRLIGDMIVIKGPYSVRYGPGFDFVDFQLLDTPRFDGYQRHGSSSFEYLTNGSQWYSRSMMMAGDEDYGYRVSYGHRQGSDYRTGSGTRLPTSYTSRDFDVAMGYDVSEDSRIEFNYLRLDQTGVEFPGLVFDINALVTDGFTLRYSQENLPNVDLVTAEAWYNATRFYGDTLGAGKNRQIPSLASQLSPFGFPVPGYARTEVDAYSAGTRLAGSWGDADAAQFTLGTDFTYLGQALDDIDDADGLGFFGPANFPIPRSHSSDVGIFMDLTEKPTENLRVNVGGRVDFVSMDSRETARDFFDNTFSGFTTYSQIKEAGLDQNFVLGSGHVTTEYDISPNWTLTGGAGHGQRPPTITELYAVGSFIGSLQPGLTAIEGDPELKSEKRTQLDLGLRGDVGEVRVAANAFHAWINDYIIYEFTEPNPFAGFTPSTSFQRVVFGNTDLATLTGFELYGEADMLSNLTTFGSLTYVEGRDHTRNEATRLGRIRRSQAFNIPAYTGTENRSVSNTDDEPLPGIVPMEGIVGLRLHENAADPYWGLELETRIVKRQDRVASSLAELPTAGFTIWNLRGFWRPWDDVTLIGGVENFTDEFYREHLDYRSGLGVFQPGVNFYMSSELVY